MIGKVLKYMRINKGLSQQEIGKLANIGRSTISDYEREKTDVNYETLENIARICGYKIFFESGKERFQAKDVERKDC